MTLRSTWRRTRKDCCPSSNMLLPCWPKDVIQSPSKPCPKRTCHAYLLSVLRRKMTTVHLSCSYIMSRSESLSYLLFLSSLLNRSNQLYCPTLCESECLVDLQCKYPGMIDYILGTSGFSDNPDARNFLFQFVEGYITAMDSLTEVGSNPFMILSNNSMNFLGTVSRCINRYWCKPDKFNAVACAATYHMGSYSEESCTTLLHRVVT